ncbi:MAG: HD-GYP domain-containing protein [Janthinobacterium lividum]
MSVPDLESIDTIARTKHALIPFVLRSIPVLFLLDQPSIQKDVQARSIGASIVLPASSGIREIADILGKLMRQGPARRRVQRATELEAAVQDVTVSLADLLAAAASGKDVSVALTAEASALLLRATQDHHIDRWLDTMSVIHDFTYRHCMLMAGLMATFAVSLGFKRADCDRLTQAAILHDIGKTLIPSKILDKAGKLTLQETSIIQTHPEVGYKLLMAQGDHHTTTLDVVRLHHEYLDGSGYPLGLKDKQIGDEIRIATICDVFAALIEERAYKASLPSSEAFSMMMPMQGKLDQDLMRLFGRLFVGVETERKIYAYG